MRRGIVCQGGCIDCRLLTALRRKLSDHVHGVVAPSRFILEQHMKRGYFQRAVIKEVVGNPYTPTRAPSPHKRIDSPFRLGFLGRLEPLKGIEVLLAAVKRLNVPFEWELWVAGRGHPAYQEYLKVRYSNPRIRFFGFVDPEDWLACIDLLVVPSLWPEPFGRVVIEAYAHGVPVVASARGALPELVDPMETGLLFDPSDPAELTNALRQLLDAPDLLTTMRERVLVKAKEFESGRVAVRLEAAYAKLVRSGSSSSVIRRGTG